MNLPLKELNEKLHQIVLPKPYSFYEVSNRRLYELRNEGGGITTRVVYFIVLDIPTAQKTYLRWAGEITLKDIQENLDIEKHVQDSLNEFQLRIQTGKGELKDFDPNGGDVGLSN